MINILSFRIYSVYNSMVSRVQSHLNLLAEATIYVENGKLSYKKAIKLYCANQYTIVWYLNTLRKLVEKYKLSDNEIECINGYVSWYENIKYYFESKEVKL